MVKRKASSEPSHGSIMIVNEDDSNDVDELQQDMDAIPFSGWWFCPQRFPTPYA